MKISKTLLIPIFLMIGNCCCTFFKDEDSLVLDEVFGSDFAMDTVCEDFYRVFKEYLSTQVDKNGDGIIDSDEAEGRVRKVIKALGI